MLEILRIQPSEVLGETEPACDIQHVTLVPAVTPTDGVAPPLIKLPFRYDGDTKTSLVVPLPRAVDPGKSVTVGSP